MKKLFPLIIIIVSLLLIGCSKKDDKTETTNKPQETTTPPSTTPVPTQTEKKEEPNKSAEEKKTPEKNVQSDKSGPIRVTFPIGTAQVILPGKMNGISDKKTYVCDAKKNQTMLIRVMSKDSKANIRIAQIISPSGKSDGPFSIKMKYDLDEAGDWKFILGENQMAGEPWTGDYEVLISIN